MSLKEKNVKRAALFEKKEPWADRQINFHLLLLAPPPSIHPRQTTARTIAKRSVPIDIHAT
jgi:hypothetical protein